MSELLVGCWAAWYRREGLRPEVTQRASAAGQILDARQALTAPYGQAPEEVTNLASRLRGMHEDLDAVLRHLTVKGTIEDLQCEYG